MHIQAFFEEGGGWMPRFWTLALLLFVTAGSALFAADEWGTHLDGEFGWSIQYPVWAETSSEAETGWFEARWLTDKASSYNVFSVQTLPLGADAAATPPTGSPQMAAEALIADLKAQGHSRIEILAATPDSLGGQPSLRLEYKYLAADGAPMRALQLRAAWRGRLYTLTGAAEEFYYFDLARPTFQQMLQSFFLPREFPSYLTDYIRIRADLGGDDAVYHWKGRVFGVVPGEKRKELFAVEGYFIVRATRKEDGYYLLGRELAVFSDPRTGEILSTWRNPYTNKDVPVVQVFNDPVNQDCGYREENWPLLPLILPSQDLGDEIAYYSEIFPYYPNPLSRRDFPLNSQNDTYQASEFTQYTASRADLADPGLNGVPASLTFTRIYPWLPFMRMGERPGNTVMFCRGRKLPGGFRELPQYLQDYVLNTRPEFISAPAQFSQPNETMWTFFRKLAAAESAPAPEPPPLR